MLFRLNIIAVVTCICNSLHRPYPYRTHILSLLTANIPGDASLRKHMYFSRSPVHFISIVNSEVGLRLRSSEEHLPYGMLFVWPFSRQNREAWASWAWPDLIYFLFFVQRGQQSYQNAMRDFNSFVVGTVRQCE